MKNKNKLMRDMLIGMVGAAICMVACWLSGAYGKGNVRNGYIQSNWPKMSYMRFEISLIVSAVGIAMNYVGLQAYIKLFRYLKRKRGAYNRQMGTLFEIGAVSYTISYLFIQSGYIMMALVYKLLFGTNLMGADIISTTEGMFFYIAIPLFAYLIISLGGMSVAYMHFVWNGKMRVSKARLLFNPLVFFGLGELLKLTKLYYLVDFAAAAIPFGVLVMMAGGLSSIAKQPAPKTNE